MERILSQQEIIPSIKGQTVVCFDEWNNISESVTVNKVEFSKDNCKVSDGNHSISIPMKAVGTLLMEGKVTTHNTIDNCVCEQCFSLLENSDYPKMIAQKKEKIKRLNKELKNLQQNYSDYLVSSVRLSVLRGA